MSINLATRYPGRANPATSDYPQGSFKNRSAPGVLDGSYLEQDWANDQFAFFQSVLAAANITPNDVVDHVGASQYFDALRRVMNIPSWSNSFNYAVPSLVFGSDNKIYAALLPSGPTTAPQNPISAPTYWQAIPTNPASTTLAGTVRLATNAESLAGTSSTIAMTPAGHAASTGLRRLFPLPDQVITNSGLVTIAHGLGVMPKFTQARLKCLTAANGYAVGDEMITGDHYDSPNLGVTIRVDATNVYVRYASAGIAILPNGGGAGVGIVNANYAFIVYVGA